MNIENAKYVNDELINEPFGIRVTIDGTETFVPLVSENRQYAEIIRQVEAGELTIQPADTPEASA